MNHRPSTLTTLLLTRLGLSPNNTARASKSRARHLLAPFAPFAVAAMLLGLAGNANAQQLSFGIDPAIDDQVYTVGQAVNVTLLNATGGTAPLRYDLTAADGSALPPPVGLVINSANRTLIGTPSVAAAAVSYRWTVTDSASPTPAMRNIDFTITVNAAPDTAPAFVAGAAIEAATFYQDTNITPLTLPRATGGEGAITYALTPAIPGMFFDTVTGVLTGAPTTAAAATDYTYTAGDTDGSAPGTDESSLTISITVLANTIPEFSIIRGPRYIFTVGTVVNQTLPEATGGDSTLIYTITRALPAGLTFNAAATPPTITGTPTTAASSVTYRYNVDDSDANVAGDDGSSLSFRITIRGAPATGITMTIRDLDGDPITSLNEGDDPTTFRLYFDTVPALSGFTADQDVAITVSTPVAGQVGYTAAGVADFIDRDVASTESRQLQLTVTDDDVATADGVVTYTATVSPSGFTATAMITLVDNEISIVTTPAAVTLATGSTADYTVQLDQEPPGSVTVSVVSVGDAIATVSRNTRVFTAANWNVPASVTVTGMRGGSTTISHSATAAGGFGYQSTDVMVTVTPVAVNFDADESIPDQIYTVGTAIDPLTLPEATGATTYRLSSHADQSLPAGLTFDGATRVLSGTPTAAQVAEGYAYSARNPDNLDNRNFDITVEATGTPTTAFTLAITPATVTESATATDLTATVTLTGGTFAVERVVTVGETTGGSATSGTDYTAVTDTPLTIPANATSGSVTIPFTATDDMATEAGGETVNFDGVLMTADGMVDSGFTAATASITIIDFVTPPTSQTLTLNPTMVTESATPTNIMATVTLVGGTYAIDRVFSFGSSSGTAIERTDYTAPQNVNLTVPATMTSGTTTFPFSATVDAIAEPDGETLTIRTTLLAPSGSGGDRSIPAGNATLTINDPVGPGTDTAPTFGAVTISPQTFTVGTAVDLTLPAATGGEGAITYTLLPAIPGLTLDATTGALTGMPTTAATAADHTYTAGDTDGSAAGTDEATLTIRITVNAAAPTVPTFGDATIGDLTYEIGTAVDLTLPVATGSTPPFFYSVRGDTLPDGLTFTPATRVLSGMPTTAGVTMHNYRVADVGARAVALMFTITITDPDAPDTAPSFGGATFGNQNYIVDTAVDLTLPVATGGENGIVYTLSTALPAGLNFDTGTRVLSGTPTAATVTAATYFYRAADGDTNTDPSDSDLLTFTITVSAAAAADTPPAFADDASVSPRSYSRFAPIPPFALPQATGGNGAITYTLTPAIPGLTLDADTGVLTGTPTTQAPLATYTLTAADSDMTTGTSDEATFTFEVVVHPLTEATGWQLGIVPAVVAESETATELTVTASYTRNGRSADERVATFQTQGGVATAGTDYIAVPPTTITIPALATNASTTISFMATPDMVTETGNESVFFVGTLRDSAGDPVTLTYTGGTLFIQDPPPVPTSVTLSVNPAMVSESADATTITVTATLDGGRFAEERRVTLSADSASTATVTTDYTPAITHTITIPALATSGSVDIPFTAVMDTAVEAGGETVIIGRNLATAGGTAAVSRDIPVTPVTLTINDPAPDTSPSFGTTVVDAQVYSVSTEVNLTLPAATDGNGVITYTLAPTALAAGLTFNAAANPPTITGTPNTQASATMYTYTARDEDGDVASLAFTIAVGAAASTPPTSQALTLNPTAVTESATATDITATVTLSGGTYNVERLFNIRTTQSGAATAVTDYTAFANVVLTIPANMASGSQTFPFTAIDDMTADDGETLRIDSSLLNPSGMGADMSLAVASATLTINDPVAGDAGPSFGSATVSDQAYFVSTAITSLTLPAATGGDGTITYTLTPALPTGLTYNATARTITGTASAVAGATAYTYTATDTANATATLMFSITVNPYITVTVDAGAVQSVGYGRTIRLNGVVPASFTAITAVWTLSNGPIATTALVTAGLSMADAVTEVTRLTAALALITTPRGTLTAPTADPQLTGPVPLVFTLMVTDGNAPAGETATATDTVTITVDEDTAAVTTALNDAILSEVTRVLVNSTAGSITRRVGQAVGGAPPVPSFNFAGQDNLASALQTHGEAMSEDSRDIKEMLAGSEFVMPLNAGAGSLASSMVFWGGGEYHNFSGESDALDWDGDLLGAQLGLDARLHNDILVGVAVSWLESEVDYKDDTGIFGKGDYELAITSTHPYIGWRAGELDFWATLGYGAGDLEITEQGETPQSRDVNLRTVGSGTSGMLWQNDDTKLRLKGEFSQSTLEVRGGAFAKQKIDATSFRVAVEAARSRTLDGGGVFAPSLEIGARYDGGDGETGRGVEAGAGLRYNKPGSRFTIDGKVRALLVHDAGYEEWGMSGTVRFAPGVDAQGVSFSVSPGYGNSGSGVQELWRHGLADDATDETDDYAMKLDARIGYGLGFALNQHHGILTPYSELTYGNINSYRMGLNWAAGTRFDLTLLGERRENTGDPVEHAVLLKGEVRF